MRVCSILAAVVLAFWAFTAQAEEQSAPARRATTTKPFLFVFIDAKTEKKLGPFPYDRSVYAKAIEKAAESGARGVVVKFFIDKPKSAEGDRALADAMTKTKVVLQARLDADEAKPNELPKRFILGPVAAGDTLTLGADSGWLPLPSMAERAHDIGFIDHQTIDRPPLVERYRGDYVKSLYICCLELAMGRSARITPGKSLEIGGKTIRLDERSQAKVEFPKTDDLPTISLIDFLEGPARPDWKDRVVVLAWDGESFAPVETPVGPMRPHRAFGHILSSLRRQLELN